VGGADQVHIVSMERSNLTKQMRQALPSLALTVACAYFLWMFLVSDALERSAGAGAFADAPGLDIGAVGHDYAQRWRHGTSGWPLFTPGFFAIALVVPWWARGKTPWQMARTSLLLIPAVIGARLTGGQFTSRLAGGFAEHYRLERMGHLEEPSIWATIPASLTIVAFVALLVSARVAVQRRSPAPAVVPLVMYFGLASVRGGGAFGQLASEWVGALADGSVVAVVSSVLFVAMAAWVVAAPALTLERLRLRAASI
jgi:hypothetical protein